MPGAPSPISFPLTLVHHEPSSHCTLEWPSPLSKQLSTSPKCSSTCRELCMSSLMSSLQLQCQPNIVKFSRALRALTIMIASRMYLVGLNITFFRVWCICVSHLLVNFTKCRASNLLPTSYLYLTQSCPPRLLPRWGKVKVSVWEAVMWHSDNDLQRKSPENKNETDFRMYLWEGVEIKVSAFQRANCLFASQKMKDPSEDPRVLKA